MANLRKTLSLVLAIVMLVSIACVSGLSVSAVAFKTVEVDTATGTYTARILVNTSAAKIGGVGCEITYPSTLTVTKTTVNSAFASSSVKADAGKITWNAVGLVDSSADFAAITVEFTGEDGLASGFSASKFEVITSANADGSSPEYATTGDDLTLEIGRYVKADEPDPTPVAITLTAEAAKTHRFETKNIGGVDYKVLIGVMPGSKMSSVLALFSNTDITTVYKNAGTAYTATANIGSGAYVENASGDRVYLAVRGDTGGTGLVNAISKTNITGYLKAADKTATFKQNDSILGYCKFLGAATANMPTKATTAVGNPNAIDKAAISAYIKSKAFPAQNISFT